MATVPTRPTSQAVGDDGLRRRAMTVLHASEALCYLAGVWRGRGRNKKPRSVAGLRQWNGSVDCRGHSLLYQAYKVVFGNLIINHSHSFKAAKLSSNLCIGLKQLWLAA